MKSSYLTTAAEVTRRDKFGRGGCTSCIEAEVAVSWVGWLRLDEAVGCRSTMPSGLAGGISC